MRPLAGLWVVAVVTVSPVSFFGGLEALHDRSVCSGYAYQIFIGHSRLGSTGNGQVFARLGMYGRVGR